MITFNVNDNDFVSLANKLEKIHRSALPIAVRTSLNDVAFDMKKTYIPENFAKNFTVRKKTFIKSHTGVNKCKNTFNIRDMISEVGVIKGKSQAGDNLEKQEFGGTIKDRDYIPFDKSRVSGSRTKLVSKRNYLEKVKAAKNKTPIKSTKLLFDAAKKYGVGTYLKYDKVILRIKSIKKGYINYTKLYSFKKGRSINVSKKAFLKPAGLIAMKNINNYYGQNAVKEIKKYANK